MPLRNIPSLSSEFSSKTITCGVQIPKLKEQLQTYFLQTSYVYECLFETVKHHKSYYIKPQPLRHPLIFYYGHTAAFFANKLFDKGLLKKRINPSYEQMFAVGVDEMDWDDLNQTHYNWPTFLEAKNYRDKVKMAVLQIIRSSQQKSISWNTNLWIVLMGIQHERIHLETSAVIIRRLPVQQLTTPNWLVQCQLMRTNINQVPKNSMAKVPSYKQIWSRQRYTSNTYGWDNQYGNKIIEVKAYKASKMLVSNAEYFQFIRQKGYKTMDYWTQQGQNWLKSTKTILPIFWIVDELHNIENFNHSESKIFLKTITNKIPMPWDWPVEVNNLQAQAFCKWKSLKTKSNLRLPTQDEYFALRNLISEDLNTWQQKSVGNINLELWFSPNPVDTFKTGQFYDILGNVWQHTITPIYPFDDFQIHPIYEDFTTPTFDNRHNIIKGGSFISTGNEATQFSRYAFRRHFYQFAGFRYVQSQNQTEIKSAIMDQSDEVVLNALKNHFKNKNSYVQETLEIIKKLVEQNDQKVLTVGCSVGRMVLQLAKIFKTSIGIDYTARYFQMATRLLEEHKLNYKEIQIDLQDILKEQGLKNLIRKVVLYQMNPQNTDNKKINGVQFMLVDGLSLRKNTITQVLENVLCLINPNQKCTIFVIQAENYNKVQNRVKNQGYKEYMKIQIKGECSGKTKQETGQIRLSVYEVQIKNKHKTSQKVQIK